MSETRSVEATGTDIEAAIQAGLEMLQVSRNSVIVEIIEEPTRGLLGLGAKLAIVRLTTAVRPEADDDTAVAEADDDDVKADETTDDEALSILSELALDVGDGDTDDTRPVASVVLNELDDAETGGKAADAGNQNDKIAVVEAYNDLLSATAATVISDEVVHGEATLVELLRLMKVEAHVQIETTQEDDEQQAPTYVLQVSGDDLSLLIGRKGESLAALQYLTRLIASRDLHHRANFVVDVGQYKAKRAAKLQQLANRMADQALEHDRVIKLEPMPPHERRIVHMALRHRDDVTTESVGEDRFRKVTIIPNSVSVASDADPSTEATPSSQDGDADDT